MPRFLSATIALSFLGFGAFLLPAVGQPSEKESPDKEVLATGAIIELLKTPIDVSALTEQTTLKKAIKHLVEDKLGNRLTIHVNNGAFREENGEFVHDDTGVLFPETPSRMPLGAALRIVASQIDNGRATFLIRQGRIEIVPANHAKAKRLLAHPILASFESRLLPDVLRELSDYSGMAIHLDPKVGKNNDTAISAIFRNTSLEDSLITVTEMAELKYVVLHNSVYVTTPGKAKIYEKEKQKKKKAQALEFGDE